jgi:Retrotransposon gag protein
MSKSSAKTPINLDVLNQQLEEAGVNRPVTRAQLGRFNATSGNLIRPQRTASADYRPIQRVELQTAATAIRVRFQVPELNVSPISHSSPKRATTVQRIPREYADSASDIDSSFHSTASIQSVASPTNLSRSSSSPSLSGGTGASLAWEDEITTHGATGGFIGGSGLSIDSNDTIISIHQTDNEGSTSDAEGLQLHAIADSEDDQEAAVDPNLDGADQQPDGQAADEQEDVPDLHNFQNPDGVPDQINADINPGQAIQFIVPAGPAPDAVVAGAVQPVAPQPNQVPDDDDFYPAMTGINPQTFRGVLADDAESWIQYADIWLSTQRAITDRAKINHIALFFRDKAANWFRGLNIVDPPADHQQAPDGAIHAYAAFRTAFLDRFRPNEAENWRETQGLWECKQRADQSTEDFVNEIQNKGVKAHALQQQILFAATAGLRDEIKEKVMAHNITELDDIIRWGTNAERYKASSAIPSDIATQIAKLVNEKLEGITVRPVEKAGDDNRGRSQSPRVRFADTTRSQSVDSAGARRRFDSPTRQSSEYQESSRPTEGPGYSAGSWRGGRRGAFRGGRGFGSRPPQNYRTGVSQHFVNYNAPDVMSNAYYDPRNAQYVSTRFANNDNSQQVTDCYRCGRNHAVRQCPAFRTSCGGCGRIGHWRDKCRSNPRSEVRGGQQARPF